MGIAVWCLASWLGRARRRSAKISLGRDSEAEADTAVLSVMVEQGRALIASQVAEAGGAYIAAAGFLTVAVAGFGFVLGGRINHMPPGAVGPLLAAAGVLFAVILVVTRLEAGPRPKEFYDTHAGQPLAEVLLDLVKDLREAERRNGHRLGVVRGLLIAGLGLLGVASAMALHL